MRRICATLWVAFWMAAAPGWAQQADQVSPSIPFSVSTPILTLNQERLVLETLFGKRIQSEREAEFAALAAENRKIEAELLAEEQALTDQRPTMEPDAFRVLANAFDDKVVAIREAQDAKQVTISRKAEEDQQNFLQRVVPVLASLAQENNAVAILDARSLILSSNAIDITDIAIARIDATMGDGTSSP